MILGEKLRRKNHNYSTIFLEIYESIYRGFEAGVNVNKMTNLFSNNLNYGQFDKIIKWSIDGVFTADTWTDHSLYVLLYRLSKYPHYKRTKWFNVKTAQLQP